MSPGRYNSQYQQISLAPFMTTNKVPALTGRGKQILCVSIFIFLIANQLQLEFPFQQTSFRRKK